MGFGSIGRRHCGEPRQIGRNGADGSATSERGESGISAAARRDGGRIVMPMPSPPGWISPLICNPTRLHVDAARRLPECGSPVLVEKPISDRVDAAEQLVEEARGDAA